MIGVKLTSPENFDQLYEKALSVFPGDYVDALRYKSTFEESLVSRLCIQDIVVTELKKDQFLPRCNESEMPQSDAGIFWSVSHKKHLVFVGVGDIPLGVDVEIMSPREQSEFAIFSDAEYGILGGKTLENFFILRTAKESVLKYEMKPIDNLEGIRIVSVEDEEKCIGDLIFERKIVLEDEFGEEFTVYSYQKQDIVAAICF